MNDLEDAFNRLFYKLYLYFGELLTIVILSLMAVFYFFFKQYIFLFFDKLGVGYFRERKERISQTLSDVIEAKGMVKADAVVLYRLSNGKWFTHIVQTEIDKHEYIYEDLKITRVYHKPFDVFPEKLDPSDYNAIIKYALTNDYETFSWLDIRGENRLSPVLSFLQEKNLTYFLVYRITDYSARDYGFLLFSWKSEPDKELFVSRRLIKILDSINIRFQNYIESSLIEKFFNIRVNI